MCVMCMFFKKKTKQQQHFNDNESEFTGVKNITDSDYKLRAESLNWMCLFCVLVLRKDVSTYENVALTLFILLNRQLEKLSWIMRSITA